MKKIRIFILLLILIIGVSNVKAERIFDTTIKIYDYAQLLNEKQETDIKKKIDKYIEKYNTDMVVVTVKHYNQNLLKEYMELFYNTNKFGIGDKRSGIMFTIDLKNDDIGIKTFGLANDLYSVNEINKILEKINNEQSSEDKITSFIKYSNKYINEHDTEVYEDSILKSINWIAILIVSLILSTIIILIGLLKSMPPKNSKRLNNNVKTLIITKKEDFFITTNTKKTRISNK